MNILPFQTNSMTKRWMEHEHTTQEVVALSLITSSLSFIAGYYQRNTCLAIGTCSFAAQQMMRRETLKGDQTPLKILSFMAFSAFVGLSLKESWSKSDITPSNPWTAPLYLASFIAMKRSARQLTLTIAKYQTTKIDENSDLKLLFLAGLTASAAFTFFSPKLVPFLALAITFLPNKAFQFKEKSLSESPPYLYELTKLSLCISLGAAIGLAARYGLGPKNASPHLPLMARVPLYFHTALFISYIFLTYLLVLSPWKNLIVEKVEKRLDAINQQKILSLEELKNYLDQNFSDLMCNRGLCDVIKMRMDRAGRSYEQALQELKALFDKKR